MAEVVVCLDSLLTLQQKIDSSLQATGKTIFGRVLDMFPFPSNGENSAEGDSNLSSNGKGNTRNAGDTIGDDNKHSTIPIPSLKVFEYDDLKRATRNFRQDLLLGREGFGQVFLGWVDRNTFTPSTEGSGIAVAVTRYSEARPEWKTVVTVLGRLAHPNIIRLLGYCNDKKPQCFLVYEHMQNQNFGHFLFGDVAGPLSWGTRLMILIGVARGLAYMHSLKDRFIHRDLKPSNILLDEDFNAKLGAFEWATIGPETGDTYIVTSLAGTLGYIDPEYVKTGRLRVGSDIYSFGVVLLETLTGRPKSDIAIVFWKPK
ncbi:hypothetical protein L1887_39335 [Cichorium endivia]|nr:hypothetical protein L1887_39335 [Cichorium endivia]